MLTFIIFIALSIIQFVLLYYKIEQMKELGTIGNAIGQATGIDSKYKPLLDRIAHFILSLRWLLWIFVPAILIINWIAAWIFSYVVEFFIFLFHS